MEADQIVFEVELESTIPAHDTTPIGPYHHGIQVPWLPKAGRPKGTEASGHWCRDGWDANSSAPDSRAPRGFGRSSCDLHLTIQFDCDAAAFEGAHYDPQFRMEVYVPAVLALGPVIIHGAAWKLCDAGRRWKFVLVALAALIWDRHANGRDWTHWVEVFAAWWSTFWGLLGIVP